jgi:hypothetical protein
MGTLQKTLPDPDQLCVAEIDDGREEAVRGVGWKIRERRVCPLVHGQPFDLGSYPPADWFEDGDFA